MARRVRDVNMESREARSKLKLDKSYHRPIERGLHLGYREGAPRFRYLVLSVLSRQTKL